DPDQLLASHHRHPPDPPLDQQETDVLDVSLFVDADNARRHDVAGYLPLPGQQVVLAHQPDHGALLIRHRNGADLMPGEQRGNVGDRRVGAGADDRRRHDLFDLHGPDTSVSNTDQSETTGTPSTSRAPQRSATIARGMPEWPSHPGAHPAYHR